MASKRSKTIPISIVIVLMISVSVSVFVSPSSAQIITGCTSTMITTFTPCLSFLTGSTNGGSSPTVSCCKSMENLLSSSAECGCLILTGNVPFSLPINRTLAISLPKMCKSRAVPLLKCTGSATPLPPPGSIAFGPALPPLPPTAPSSSFTPATPSVLPPFKDAPPEAFAPEPEGSVTPSSIQDFKPSLFPNVAVKASTSYSTCFMVLVVVGVMMLK